MIGQNREIFVRFNMSAYGQITCSLSRMNEIKVRIRKVSSFLDV